MSVWLVLSEECDPVGSWVADGLRARGLAPVHHLTSEDLIHSTIWSHAVGDDGAAFSATVSDEIEFSSWSIAGILNRIGFISPAHTGEFVDTDRDYALHEWNAFFMSWLNSLDGPVLNPPSSRGLAGAWRPASEWAHLARQAGLAHRPVRSAEDEGAPFAQPAFRAAFVVGDEIVDDGLDDETRQGCLRLADLSSTPLLGVEFGEDEFGRPVLTGASPQPPLQIAGEPILDALAYVFEGSLV